MQGRKILRFVNRKSIETHYRVSFCLEKIVMPDISIIQKYFPGLTSKQQEQFSKLYDLYSHWNAQINVISRKDIDQLYERHVLHSLAIAKFISFKPGTKILYVGTGGGIPGIPLAIIDRKSTRLN